MVDITSIGFWLTQLSDPTVWLIALIGVLIILSGLPWGGIFAYFLIAGTINALLGTEPNDPARQQIRGQRQNRNPAPQNRTEREMNGVERDYDLDSLPD